MGTSKNSLNAVSTIGSLTTSLVILELLSISGSRYGCYIKYAISEVAVARAAVRRSESSHGFELRTSQQWYLCSTASPLCLYTYHHSNKKLRKMKWLGPRINIHFSNPSQTLPTTFPSFPHSLPQPTTHQTIASRQSLMKYSSINYPNCHEHLLPNVPQIPFT